MSQSDETKIALLEQKLCDMETKIDEIKDMLKERFSAYVTQDQFYPVRNIVYGMVGLILVAFLSALVALVLKTT